VTLRLLRAVVACLLLAASVLTASVPASAAAPTRIMALGDSITGSPGCWRALLWKHLQDTGYTNIDFVGSLPASGCGFTHDGENEGHGGILATNIVRDNRLPGWLSSARPDVVLMHLGTNDVWSNIPASTILGAYTTMLGQMRASNPAMKVVVAKIIPMNPANCGACGQRVVDLNNAIPGWAQANSTAASPITVVDQWTGFDTAADTTDGVHPNGTTGIGKMESRWYPAVVAALGTDTPATGLHVSGTQVVEANGAAFVMRGVNHAYIWYPTQNRAFADMKSFGTNTVRVVLGSGQRWGPTPAAEVTNVITLCKQNKMICVLEVHDTTGFGEQSGAASLDQAATYWISVANALKGQENYVIINLGNEPFGNNATVSATWASATSSAISRLRGAGLQHLLMADAPMWGQDWGNIMRDNAATVFNADPQRNTVFSVHMYGVYNTAAKVNAYFDAFRTAGLPLVVGEFGHNHSDGDPDEDTIMAQAQARGLGYLGWSWSGNSGGVEYLDMTNSFNPASLTPWGERFLNGANGVRLTSKEATIFGGGGGPDTEAPSIPGTPAASGVTSSSVTLNWTASTDNVGVAGYDVYRAPGAGGGSFTLVGSTASTTHTDTGLTASTTYRYQVRAKDSAGNTSAASGSVTATTGAGGGTGACKVGYSAPAWGGGNGFTASVTITNTGTSTVNGWTLAFTYAGGQQVTLPGWGATFAQSGGNVTATNLTWNRALAPNASTSVGFNGTYSGTNPAPTSFTLNGNTCTTG
jgi:mannan endo-1,4-beta-mannosidase